MPVIILVMVHFEFLTLHEDRQLFSASCRPARVKCGGTWSSPAEYHRRVPRNEVAFKDT